MGIQRFDISKLSKVYQVRLLQETDIPAILALCQGNPKYYHHCPPAVSEETIRHVLHHMI